MKKAPTILFVLFYFITLNNSFSQVEAELFRHLDGGWHHTIIPITANEFLNFDSKPLGRRTLIIKNSTSYTLKIYVAYRTRFSGGNWKWVNKDYSLYWTIAPGESRRLKKGLSTTGNPWIINADYIRIWAEKKYGSNKFWTKYKNDFLRIGYGPPEKGVIGNYTYTFTN